MHSESLFWARSTIVVFHFSGWVRLTPARRGGPPPIRLLSRLGVTVDCPASMPPQFLKRSLADVAGLHEGGRDHCAGEAQIQWEWVQRTD